MHMNRSAFFCGGTSRDENILSNSAITSERNWRSVSYSQCNHLSNANTIISASHSLLFNVTESPCNSFFDIKEFP